MKAYIFPGQGSQKKGMGESLFDEFGEQTAIADKVLGYSIKELCLHDPDNKLINTQYTQPALYVVNCLTYLKKIKEGAPQPEFVAGHSLGEYSALFAGGVFDFETGLKLVKYRGELMSRAENGGMAAVIGMSEEQIAQTFKDHNINDIDVANFNSPSQIVISGRKESVVNAKEAFEKSGAKHYIVLNVGGAFHSRYMDAAHQKFRAYIDEFTFADIKTPIISNVTARPHTPEAIKENLAKQIVSSVKWTESVRYIQAFGSVEFEEVGPGYALTGLVNKISKESSPLNIAENEKQEVLQNKFVNKEQDKIPPGSKQDTTAQEATADGTICKMALSAGQLGSKAFKEEYNVKLAYVAGSLYHGISSATMVAKLANARILGILGSRGLSTKELAEQIQEVKKNISPQQPFGTNISYRHGNEQEMELVELLLKEEVTVLETSGFTEITEALAYYKLSGIKKNGNQISCGNRVIAKITSEEEAALFLEPVPAAIAKKLYKSKKISKLQCDNANKFPLANDLCILANSAGNTQIGNPVSLFPAIKNLQNAKASASTFNTQTRLGIAGSIGTPETAASAFTCGADFILTGSINLCTAEAELDSKIKDKLNNLTFNDTDFITSELLSDSSSKEQIVKTGSFFFSHWDRLNSIYASHNSVDELDADTISFIEKKCFHKSLSAVFEDIEQKLSKTQSEMLNNDPKLKLKQLFIHYKALAHKAGTGNINTSIADYCLPCSPSLAAMNQWLSKSPMANWEQRNIELIAEKIMDGAASHLSEYYNVHMN